MAEVYKEEIGKNREGCPSELKETIKKLQQERERLAEPGPFSKFNRPKIRELDEKIERLMQRLGVWIHILTE